jgi:hypothetical protein
VKTPLTDQEKRGCTEHVRRCIRRISLPTWGKQGTVGIIRAEPDTCWKTGQELPAGREGCFSLPKLESKEGARPGRSRRERRYYYRTFSTSSTIGWRRRENRSEADRGIA